MTPSSPRLSFPESCPSYSSLTKGNQFSGRNFIQSFFLFIAFFFCLPINPLLSQDNEDENPVVQSLQDLPLDSSFAWMNRNVYSDTENYQSVGRHAINRAILTKEDTTIAIAYDLMADWHGYHGLYSGDSVTYYDEKVLEYYLKVGDKERIATTYKILSIDYLNIGKYEKGQEILFQALKIFEELEDELGIAGVYRSLADYGEVMKEPEQGIKYADLAMEILKDSENYHAIAILHLTYTNCYRMLGNYDKAYEAADYCLEIVNTRVPEEVFIATRAYSFRGDISMDVKDYQQAYDDYEQSWIICKAKIGEERAASYRSGIGKASLALNRYEEALGHLLAAIISLEESDKQSVPEYYTGISTCYKKLGNYQKAMEYHEKALKLKDEIHEETVATMKSEMLVKYEMGKKDQTLLAQEEQLKQKNQIQNLTFGVVVLLAALLFGLAFFFQKNKKTNTQLNIKNKENELLLKEIHHRVKNNLQTISSLLSLQSNSISDPSALNAVQESRNRVASMALIHQKLYQGENLAAIEMRDYFNTIGLAIKDSFGEKAEDVSLEVEMPEIELDVDTAIPIGLITNELITNSLKYAFSPEQEARISISLKEKEKGMLTLKIADNGENSSNMPASDKEKGFGSMLIQLLTTQLAGTLEISTEAGTSTVIEFPLL